MQRRRSATSMISPRESPTEPTRSILSERHWRRILSLRSTTDRTTTRRLPVSMLPSLHWTHLPSHLLKWGRGNAGRTSSWRSGSAMSPTDVRGVLFCCGCTNPMTTLGLVPGGDSLFLARGSVTSGLDRALPPSAPRACCTSVTDFALTSQNGVATQFSWKESCYA